MSFRSRLGLPPLSSRGPWWSTEPEVRGYELPWLSYERSRHLYVLEQQPITDVGGDVRKSHAIFGSPDREADVHFSQEDGEHQAS